MASGIYEEIWKLIRRYSFVIDFHQYDDLLCSLCNKILINAVVSPCGCRYCHDCIERYLNGEEKCCPRPNIACKKQVINFKRDLKIDDNINRKVSLIRVACPKSFCQFTDELKNIPSHLKSHKSKGQFSVIGCTESKNHLDNNKRQLQNLQNEMEISEEKSSKNENLINNLNEELTLIKEEHNSLTSQLATLETFNQNQNTINNKINNKLNGFQNLVINNLEKYTMEYAPFEYKIKNIFNIINNSNYSNPTYILTDKFLSHPNGYTMQLKIYPRGDAEEFNESLTIEFGIIEGQYDNDLTWPMKMVVEIALINQYTNKIHVSEKFHFNDLPKRLKCIFFKPSMRHEHDNTYFFGTRNFIDLDELMNNEDLCMNNSIVVKCFVY